MAGKKRSSDTPCVPAGRKPTTASDPRDTCVKKLLEKLPETERTIIVLYYLGERTPQEIGHFLGGAVNTIARRLQGARKLLQEDQVRLIEERLGSVQISECLTQPILCRVSNIKPKPPRVRKQHRALFFIVLGIAIIVVFALKWLNH